ncbi:MAG: putative 2-dehydropantoate 2-reductase [Bacteroidales bacterium]|nr:putative 2-dehydropantoate 2-reductase [Bacteroidales bacterium]
MKLKYAIIGTGALGGFYGGKLAKAGHSVEFLLNSDYEYVKEKGLRIDSVLGDFHLPDISAFRQTEEMSLADVVFVCLKTTQNHLLKKLLPPILHENTLIILLQNGLGVEADVAKEFPNQMVAGGVAFICSQKVGAGHITHLDLGKIIMGMHQGDRGSVLKQICENFISSGIDAEMTADLDLIRWRKLVWNIPFNGTTVVMNTTTNSLILDEATRPLIYSLMNEVVCAANACGVALNEEFARKMIDMTEAMMPYEPSMKIDFDLRREMEIFYIYTRPIELAAAAGYDMIRVRMLEQELRFMQKNLSNDKG